MRVIYYIFMTLVYIYFCMVYELTLLTKGNYSHNTTRHLLDTAHFLT